MGMQIHLLLVKLCLITSALPVYGSADVDFSPKQPPHYERTIHGNVFDAPPCPEKAPTLSPTDHSSTKVIGRHHVFRPSSNIALAPAMSSFQAPPDKWVRGGGQHHHTRNKFSSIAPAPSYVTLPPTYSKRGSISKSRSPFPRRHSPTPLPSRKTTSRSINMPIPSPTISPLASYIKRMRAPPPLPIMTLPPPPPNADCTSLTCTEPLTHTPPGSPCGCVWPIQVKLQLGIAIYTFFPLVSELADEISSSVGLTHVQVQIMGANAANQQLDRSTVLINLVPRGVKFDDITAFSIYKKFWRGQVFIRSSLFGAYEVVYVRYPGLPPSPPSTQSSISTTEDGPFPGRQNGGQIVKPIGAEVPRRKNGRPSGSMIAVIVLSSITAFVLCLGFATLLALKCGAVELHNKKTPDVLKSSPPQPSGASKSRTYASKSSSASMSYGSGTLTYTGSAKTFTIIEIERATNRFDKSRIIGEGGFGVVYRGLLDDGREVAVKVLKRDDQRGGQEFMAEVEMLSRLHHRNLVKLIGICTEDYARYLVYELIPNGSVESHLHCVDKETSVLDWSSRMKIALGAARGLAYLHEDSSPRVIHRDFKSSNILLENDFTPKVSDFGLARIALDDGHKHISTHVMGTFGYLAPEYAMTGHLLVKSDVYSYGVVLLELLTGRKPVDLSQPPGQENLVAWARPLLTTKEYLESIVDPCILSNTSTDSIAKVAAIASMCVQPEVSHRPFMGEVVQALKLVCNEFDETKELATRDESHGDISLRTDNKFQRFSGEIIEVSEAYHAVKPSDLALSSSDLLRMPAGLDVGDNEVSSFRWHSSSGPLKTGRRKSFWQRLRSLSRGSKSEHGLSTLSFQQVSHD